MSNHEGIWTEYRPTYADHWSACKRMGDLVRCRDCKHYHDKFNGCDEFGDMWHDEYANVEPDGFCAWGERKDA